MADRILITGANRGIGLEMTRQAAAAGHQVPAACRKPDKADELNALAADSGGRITVIGMEVRDEASVHAAAAHVGSLDLVVCNAGTLNARGGLTDPGHTPENIAESLMTNIAGVFFTARHFAGHLKGAAAPRIAVISSQMGSRERAGTTAPRDDTVIDADHIQWQGRNCRRRLPALRRRWQRHARHQGAQGGALLARPAA